MGTLGGTGNVWGTAAKTAVDGLTVPQDRVTTPAELETFWQDICNAHVTHIVENNVITTTSGGATGSGPPGGPLPIVALPGTGGLT